ncbi:hypothetical protein IX51_08650 [uncultured archaeon]|nr:hypothetical protein IX51_08650 [uncultured archaeon]
MLSGREGLPDNIGKLADVKVSSMSQNAKGPVRATDYEETIKPTMRRDKQNFKGTFFIEALRSHFRSLQH